MPHDIDRLVDRRTSGKKSPGEKLRDSFLDSRPVSQWPSYLDETAIDIQAHIGIGDTGLDRFNFPEEVGPLYRQGMLATAGEHTDLSTVMDGHVTNKSLGQLVFLLNQLQYKISRSDTGLKDIQRAITAVLEKLMSDAHGQFDPHLSEGINSTADILMQLFSDPDVAEHAKDIVDRFEETYNRGLLAKLDEPQMMTPLWDHQRDALANWAAAEYRGYADMATATGKTVLGLAAIALRYGGLHPFDADIDRQRVPTSDRKAEVLIVAHNDLILEQWRREFDRHLNIPEDRTQRGDDVELTWGRIHFRTAQALLNRDYIEYDLVILDEAHHYANGTGWGQLLDSFDNDVLALSGSVDEGKEKDSKLRERLESTIGPEIKHYTITDAQRDGVIPTFDWRVEYVPTGDIDSEFIEITEKANVRFSAFRDRIERGELRLDTDRRLRTHEDVRQFSHTSEGKELKREDDDFKELVTTLFSRRTQRWNQSPRLDIVVETIQQYSHRKVVVLTNNNAQIERLTELLGAVDDIDTEQIFTVRGSDTSAEQRDTVDAFDQPGEPAILIGTGDLVGEGVDMQHASVGINMSTGSVNAKLIQRIGRVLRNPDGDKQATFVNLSGIPTKPEAQSPADDGQLLIENAQRYVAFGDRFDNRPTFGMTPDTIADALDRLLDAGYDRIQSLQQDSVYKWPETSTEREQLKMLLSAIQDERDNGPQKILVAWSPDTDLARTDDSDKPRAATPSKSVESGATGNGEGKQVTQTPIRTLVLEVTDQNGDPLPETSISVVGDDVTRYGRTDKSGQLTLEVPTASCSVAVRHPSGGVRTVEVTEAPEQNRQTIRLPAAGDT